MANLYKGLTIQLGADTSDLSKALREAQKLATGTTKEMRLLNKELKADPTNITMLSREQDVLKRKIQSTKQEIEVLKQAEEQLSEQDIGSEAWTKLQTDIQQAERDLTKYEEQLSDVERQYAIAQSGAHKFGDALDTVGTKLQRAGDKIQSISQGVSSFGDSYTQKITAPLTAAAGAAVVSAMTIDDSLTSVKKTVDGTEEQYEALKDAAIEFSKTNAVSADQILELQALGAQLGFGIEQLEEFGRVASGLDIATNMDAETAATEMAQFMNITGKTKDEISNYASAIVNLGNHLATTESDLSHMAQRIAAAGYQVGMSRAEILGFAGALTSMGLNAEAGGTAISTTLSTIDKDVATNSERLKNWAKTAGMSVEEFSNAWKENAAGTFEDLLVGLATSVEEGDNMTVMLEELGITAIRQTDAMKRLASNTDLVHEAIAYSNEGWEANLALQDEVGNRNASLSSRFAMLKNRVVAVAESVGKPLANALLEAIDAAEPLINMVEQGAEAFSNMSKAEQQQIIQAIAAVAALGPLLSIAGRVGNTFGGMVNGIGGATKALGSLADKIGEYKAGIKGAGTVSGKLVSSVFTLKGGMIGLGVAIAGVAAAIAVKAWLDYQKRLSDIEKASKSLSKIEKEVNDELSKTSTSADKAKDGILRYEKSISQVQNEIDELRQAQIKANESFAESFKNYTIDDSKLQGFVSTIEKLANNDLPLTAREQTELRLAVEGYNEITGESIEIINAETGKLSESTETLKANSKAWETNARVKIYQERYTAALEEQIKAEENVEAATNNANTAQEAYNRLLNASASEIQNVYGGWEAYSVALNGAKKAVLDTKKAESEAKNELYAANQITQEAVEKITALQSKQDIYAKSTTIMSDKIAKFSDSVKKSLSDAGIDIDNLSDKLSELGVDTGKLSQISSKKFEELAKNCGGSLNKFAEDINSFISKYGEMNSIVISKTNEMSDAVKARMSEAGFNTEQFAQKCVDAGISTDYMKSLTKENYQQILASVNYNMDEAIKKIKGYNNTYIQEKTAQIKIQQNIDDVKKKWNELKEQLNAPLHGRVSIDYIKSQTNNVLTGKHAAGGIAIPKHASGGILATPTITNIGWVGEAGAEAIIPLDNARYVTPFARAVAQQMSQMTKSYSTVNQVNLNGVTVNDDAAIEDAMLTLLELIQRKAAMNRG